MISLNVYLTPKSGRAAELESVVHDRWIKTMSEQPGFLRAAALKPFPDDELVSLQAIRPENAYEVVTYWETEAQRVAWTQRPIHDEVWADVLAASESVTYTLQTVEGSWNM